MRHGGAHGIALASAIVEVDERVTGHIRSGKGADRAQELRGPRRHPASDKREALRAQAEMDFDRDKHVLHHGLVSPELTGIVRPVAGRIVRWE